MARPAGSPSTFATDTNYTNSAGRDWQGTATKVEPSSGEKAQGITPGRKIVAQWLNWLLGGWSAWVAYFASIIDSNDELTYLTPKTRVVYVSLPGGMSLTEKGHGAAFAAVAFGDAWAPKTTHALGAGPGGTDLILQDGTLATSAAGLWYTRCVSDDLVSGTTLDEILFGVQAGVVEANADLRMKAVAFKRHSLTAAITNLGAGSVTFGSGAGYQAQSIAGIDHVVNKSLYTYHVSICSSVNAASTADELHDVRLQFLDIGPRNN